VPRDNKSGVREATQRRFMDVLRTAGIRKRKEGVVASTREDRGAAASAFSEYPQMLSAISNSENALARRFSAGASCFYFPVDGNIGSGVFPQEETLFVVLRATALSPDIS
jgi:hypothetical protein